jgi:hypothetical protein
MYYYCGQSILSINPKSSLIPFASSSSAGCRKDIRSITCADNRKDFFLSIGRLILVYLIESDVDCLGERSNESEDIYSFSAGDYAAI